MLFNVVVSTKLVASDVAGTVGDSPFCDFLLLFPVWFPLDCNFYYYYDRQESLSWKFYPYRDPRHLLNNIGKHFFLNWSKSAQITESNNSTPSLLPCCCFPRYYSVYFDAKSFAICCRSVEYEYWICHDTFVSSFFFGSSTFRYYKSTSSWNYYYYHCHVDESEM